MSGAGANSRDYVISADLSKSVYEDQTNYMLIEGVISLSQVRIRIRGSRHGRTVRS